MELPAIVPVAAPPQPAPVPTGMVLVPDGQYENLLMAQQQTEEFEYQQQQVVERFAQYDNLISERDTERERALAEIERLRLEVEAAKIKADKDAARRAKSRAIKKEI